MKRIEIITKQKHYDKDYAVILKKPRITIAKCETKDEAKHINAILEELEKLQ